jgi:AcrR family transcriptional regulator
MEQNGRFVREKSMDRRQKKSREAIFRAFGELLETKSFHRITVQEIIDAANVGRSTFYAHFETKEALLKALCADVFEHIASTELESESSHDFSLSGDGLQIRLTHLLYHLKDEHAEFTRLIRGESREVFIGYMKLYLNELFEQYEEIFPPEVPPEFVANHLASGFAHAILWWVNQNMVQPPEDIVHYYMSLVRIG